MNHPSIIDDGFADDTAPSTPYVSRRCIVTRRWFACLRPYVARWLRAILRSG